MEDKFQPRRKRRIATWVLIISVTCASFGGFAGGMLYQDVTYADQTAADLTVPAIASKTSDSVVEIRTETVSTGQYMRQYTVEGAGSGVVIRSDGYIVTNNHVIDGASKITVRMRDGTTYNAALVGKDSATDLAVLKIEATGLTAAEYGKSSELVVGELAVVIGNPLGQLGGTVTDGIISALDREITIDGRTMNLLQTNAAINPGNSGGGLFDSQGKLVGIVAAKSSGEDVEGLGFAIPIDDAIPVIEEIVSNGYVAGRVSLGMDLIDRNAMTQSFQSLMFGFSQSGVYVDKVETGSNADKAGFRAGDRILAMEDTKVSKTADVTQILSKYQVGDQISVTIYRGGQTATLSLTLGEYTP